MTCVVCRPVEINPEAASVRVMGARFGHRLLHPRPAGHPQRRRARHSNAARCRCCVRVRVGAGASSTPRARPSTRATTSSWASCRVSIADRTIDDWGRTVYDAWLYAVEPMWQSHGTAFPDFMQTPAWNAKSHQTGFGSYTELKHDTILYTKQAVAEGGGEEPPVPPTPLGRARSGRVRTIRCGHRAAAHRPSESRSAPD